MKKLGIVIVNYNDSDTTIDLLKRIKNFKSLNHIVVVDNASTDDSYDKLREYERKNITIIKNSKNNGYAYGLNTGAKYLIRVLGKCNIIFSNSDIIIKDDADLKELSSKISGDIAVVGPTIEEKGSLNRGWKRSSVWDEVLYNLPLISRLFRLKSYYPNSYYSFDISYVDVVSGCFFVVDSEILKMVHYFDENTFLYYEEMIFSKKLFNIGKKEVVDNTVSVIHNHSVTIDKNVNRVRKYKILKQSQKYYCEEYLKASPFSLCFLWMTNKLSLGILHIRNLFRR